MKVVTSYNNFARAKIDHDMSGRYDLPIYSTGTDEFRNFISNFKGNAIYRCGFENMLAHQDCALIEFKFSDNQNYILVMYNTVMRFLSYDINGNFGWVLNGGATPLEVTTPYTLAESKEIAFRKSYTQNSDVMIITHEDHEPRKLVRLAANDFTFNTYSRKDDPFPLTWQATKAITGVTQATAGVVTAVAHGYSTGDRVKIAGITGMTELNGYTARVIVLTADTFSIDVDTTTFTAYSANGTAAKVLTGDYPSVALFYKGRLNYAASRLKITTIWMSESGFYYVHTLPATVTDASAIQITLAEIAQRIEWLFAGDNSLIAGAGDGIVAINGGGVGTPITSATIEASLTPCDGTNGAEPHKKDRYIFYIGKDGRNLYFFNYDILTETFIAEDANILSYDITRGGVTKFRHVKDRNDIVYCLRGDGEFCSVNFNVSEKIVGWHEHDTEGLFKDLVQISDNDGKEQLFTLTLRNSVYYIERLAPYVEFVARNDFFTDDEAEDEEAYTRYIAEQLKGCIFLDNSETVSNLKSTTITYSSGAGTITAGAASFSSGDVGKHIVYKTTTGYESGRFLITAYTSTTVVSVSVLQTPTANVYSSWYLTFSTISGLSRFNGLEIGVVTDGGFLDTFTVSGGAIDLEDQVTHAVVGYIYRGLIKSFSLGFMVQGENTQTTMKAISRVGVRMVTSAGGNIGSSPYALEAVQELSQNDLNYLPPLPIDGTKYVTYSDDNQKDKYFYIVQDEPLPLHVVAVMVDCSYSFTR